MRLYCYLRQSLFPHYCAAVRSSLLNLLKRQLVYILFGGKISSGYDALACMPDAKKREDDKSDPRTLSTPAAQANYSENRLLQLLSRYWVFN